MSAIPDDIMEAARDIAEEVVSCTAPSGPLAAQVKIVAQALQAAEKRGEQREREAQATAIFDRPGFMIASSGDEGKPFVKISFDTLADMQAFHKAFAELSKHRAIRNA